MFIEFGGFVSKPCVVLRFLTSFSSLANILMKKRELTDLHFLLLCGCLFSMSLELSCIL